MFGHQSIIYWTLSVIGSQLDLAIFSSFSMAVYTYAYLTVCELQAVTIIYKCKKYFIKMLKDVAMVVSKTKETIL